MRIRIWDNTPDKAGHKILVKNIDLSRYEQNPVLLYDHRGYGLPIGNVVNLEKSADGLYGDLQFDDSEDDYMVKTLKKKYENGVMRGVSPRFFAYEPTEIASGLTEWGRAELVEVSLVTLPSHKNAVVLKKNLDEVPEGATDLNPFVPLPEASPEPKTKLKPMKELFKSLGLAADEANEAKAINAVADLKKRLSDVEAEDARKATEITDLKKTIQDQKDAATEKEIEALVDGAVSQKKITATQAPEYKELCKSEGGLERVKKIFETITPAKSITDTLAATGATELNKKLAERESWDYMKWMKEDSAGLEELKSKNPQKFEELRKSLG